MLDHREIQEILPHGHPMLLLDRVTSLDPHVSITATKAISGCEPCYQSLPPGLSPSRYAFPASLLLESFGQAAAVLWLKSSQRVEDWALDSVLMVTAMRNCRIEDQVFPGDVVTHVVRLEHLLEDAVFVAGAASVEARRVLTVDSMMAVIRPRSVITGGTDQDE